MRVETLKKTRYFPGGKHLKKIARLKTVAKGKNFLPRIWYQVANLILQVLTGHITSHLQHSTLEL